MAGEASEGLNVGETQPAAIRTREPSVSNFPTKIRALILEKLFALTEDVRLLFQLGFLSKSIKAELALAKPSVQTLHVTLNSRTIPASLNRFVQSFPAVEHLKATFVFDDYPRHIDAPEITAWLRHWNESLMEVTVDVQGPVLDRELFRRVSYPFCDNRLLVALDYTAAAQGSEQPCETFGQHMNLEELTQRQARLTQQAVGASLGSVVEKSKIELVTIRNSHKLGSYSFYDNHRVLWRGPKTQHLRIEGKIGHGLRAMNAWNVEKLELINHNNPAHEASSSKYYLRDEDGDRQELDRFVRVACNTERDDAPLKRFTYLDISGEVQKPLMIEIQNLSKLQTLRVLSCNPTSIAPLHPSESLVMGTVAALQSSQSQLATWELRTLVTDTGFQSCYFGPSPSYMLWPLLERLFAVRSTSYLGPLSAVLRGLRAHCPLLKRVQIGLRGGANEWVAVVSDPWVTTLGCASQEHEVAGSPFDLVFSNLLC